MTTTRTKQQIACDGVRVVWHGGDTFTDILQQQVEMQFSMDGVIPLQKIDSKPMIQKAKKVMSQHATQKPQFGRSLDGIRFPWKEAYAV